MTPSTSLGPTLCLALAALFSGCGWVRGSLEEDRAARIAELQALPAEQRHDADELDVEVACNLAELQQLEGEHALAVDCSEAVLAPGAGGAFRLEGVLAHTGLDHALLGDGGHRRKLCIVPSDEGWAVLGEAYTLGDCDFAVIKGASVEVQRTAAVQGIAAAEEALARQGLAATRAGLASASQLGAVPTQCRGLPEVSARQLLVVDSRVLDGQGLSDSVTLSSAVARACSGEEVMGLECRLKEPWTHALVIRVVDSVPPTSVDSSHFSGGHWTGVLLLIDLEEQTLLCQRPMKAQLELARFLLPDFHDEVAEAFCEETEALGRGQLSVDPYWGCD